MYANRVHESRIVVAHETMRLMHDLRSDAMHDDEVVHSENGEREFRAAPQVEPTAYRAKYDDRRRWSSYWVQLEHAIAFARHGPMLEIGVGSGLITSYLRTVVGATVTTIDIDQRLSPDVVSDITRLPFADGAFGCVIACQVLEHLPYEQSTRALRELRRVARHGIISVPNAGRWYLQLFLGVGTRRKRLLACDAGTLPFSAAPRRSTPSHYWELGLDGVSVDRFTTTLKETGWTTRSAFRNPDNPYHHFFILDHRRRS